MNYALDGEEVSRLDEVVEERGVKVIVESKALMFLIGTEMDFVDDEIVMTDINFLSICSLSLIVLGCAFRLTCHCWSCARSSKIESILDTHSRFSNPLPAPWFLEHSTLPSNVDQDIKSMGADQLDTALRALARTPNSEAPVTGSDARMFPQHSTAVPERPEPRFPPLSHSDCWVEVITFSVDPQIVRSRGCATHCEDPDPRKRCGMFSLF